MERPADILAINGVWSRVAEPIDWIVDVIDSTVSQFSEKFGVYEWQAPVPKLDDEQSGEPEGRGGGSWVLWANDPIGVVRQSSLDRIVAGATLDEGFRVSVFGKLPGGGEITLSVNAGSTFIGRRVPEHRVGVRVSAPVGGQIDGRVSDVMIAIIARIFEPQSIAQVSSEIFSRQRRGGWKIAASHRLWLHHSVVEDPILPVGMLAEEVESGILYSVDDDCSPEQVIVVHEKFRDLNELDVLPH